MKADELLDIIGDADDSMVYAAKSQKKPKKNRVKWAAMAACFCLMIASVSMILRSNFSGHDNTAEISMLEYNGVYYEVTDDADILQKYGLPQTLTAECVGEHVAYLAKSNSYYSLSANITEIEMFSYASAPCMGVYVIYEEGEYLAALFCNHVLDSDAFVSFDDIYEIYAIENANDIASISISGGTSSEIIIADKDALLKFYDASLSLECFSNDGFQKAEIETLATEEMRTAHYDELAKDRAELNIKTSSGLVIHISAYPNYGWLNGDLSYFKFNDAMTGWFSEYVG